jgi:hypothetical protein
MDAGLTCSLDCVLLQVRFGGNMGVPNIFPHGYGKKTQQKELTYMREHRDGTTKSSWPGAAVSCTGSRQVS